MQTRAFGSRCGERVSALGFGAMRLPLRDGRVDEAAAVEVIEAGFAGGVTYVDTAPVYNDGQSEQAVGRALSRGWRGRVRVATKLPVWEMRRPGDQDAVFEGQLARLGQPQVDFYLLHALNKRHWRQALDARSLEWLDAEKRRGRIRYAGFSFHDDLELFRTVVDAYDWDFCQIQYNYAQPEVQAGVSGLRYAAAKGLGVAIMEPLFGGFLAPGGLPPEAARLFAAAGLDPVASALRWLWDQPEVGVVLSGMGDLRQVRENLGTAARAGLEPLTPRERQVLDEVCRSFNAAVPIACSACGYCLPHCPVGVRIPVQFDLYNKHVLTQRRGTLHPALYRGQLEAEKASSCVRCGACLARCPQALDIPSWLAQVAAEFEPAPRA